jgi:hypothetical protein
LPGGFTGVDVFFVISGFVVSASVHRLPPLSLGQSMLRFYARRIRRIAPALLTCLLLTAVASVLFIPESWLSEAGDKTGLMAFFGFSNWVLAAIGNDYFAQGRVQSLPIPGRWAWKSSSTCCSRCCSWPGRAAHAGVGSAGLFAGQRGVAAACGAGPARGAAVVGVLCHQHPSPGNWAWACCCSSCCMCANRWTRQPARH